MFYKFAMVRSYYIRILDFYSSVLGIGMCEPDCATSDIGRSMFAALRLSYLFPRLHMKSVCICYTELYR